MLFCIYRLCKYKIENLSLTRTQVQIRSCKGWGRDKDSVFSNFPIEECCLPPHFLRTCSWAWAPWRRKSSSRTWSCAAILIFSISASVFTCLDKISSSCLGSINNFTLHTPFLAFGSTSSADPCDKLST